MNGTQGQDDGLPPYPRRDARILKNSHFTTNNPTGLSVRIFRPVADSDRVIRSWCGVTRWVMTEAIDEGLLTPSKSESRLNNRELEMYREHRRKLLTWMLNKGRAPEMNVGYAEEIVENRSYRLDMFYRWVWDIEDGYTENITISHANAFMKYLQPQSYSQAYKAAYQKSIHTLFRWQKHALTKNVDRQPTLHFYDSAVPSSVEPLTHDERQALREAVLDHESVPHYNSLSPKQRDRWKSYLAQRFQKPKPEVSKEDFERANSWKWPSLI
jgi:hypothetical protein